MAARGFTLVEMMMAVVIIGVIAALAAPNITGLYRRMSLAALSRQLNSAFVTTQGLATAKGQKHCILLSKVDQRWSIREDSNDDSVCDPTDKLLHVYPPEGGSMPGDIGLGPASGSTPAFPAPYSSIAHNSWCSLVAGSANTASVVFDIDGRIIDTNDAPQNGSVMVTDSKSGAIKAVVFVGATGNIRTFDMQE
ncbi:MAG: prepilin-type N-terminal cleavage/methylation domain-containing protein [Deltaproteobacteria bacterium]|nr:prepilin-type N-terminal cleavage/methylation domain-containing protein [Deltaproteobacteria bacterium]